MRAPTSEQTGPRELQNAEAHDATDDEQHRCERGKTRPRSEAMPKSNQPIARAMNVTSPPQASVPPIPSSVGSCSARYGDANPSSHRPPDKGMVLRKRDTEGYGAGPRSRSCLSDIAPSQAKQHQKQCAQLQHGANNDTRVLSGCRDLCRSTRTASKIPVDRIKSTAPMTTNTPTNHSNR
jgi:hypothetical protein